MSSTYTKAEFFALLSPTVIQVRREGSKLLPSVRLAQNWLETGGTIHDWNNLGGYKVGSGTVNEYWKGASVSTSTWEVYNGQSVETTANWRAYDSIYDFYKDQDLLFAKARYSRVCEALTPEEQCEALYLCGYATDPDYASKLNSIIRTNQLTDYDEEAERMTADEKAMVEELQAAVKAQENLLDSLTNSKDVLKSWLTSVDGRLKTMENKHRMDIPEWAREAVEAAVNAQLVDTPENGSEDFYRLLTIIHRKGLI